MSTLKHFSSSNVAINLIVHCRSNVIFFIWLLFLTSFVIDILPNSTHNLPIYTLFRRLIISAFFLHHFSHLSLFIDLSLVYIKDHVKKTLRKLKKKYNNIGKNKNMMFHFELHNKTKLYYIHEWEKCCTTK